MSLPTEKSKPQDNLNQYLTMIYGRPGVGKTTLAAQFDNPLFLMFEPGAKSLSIYKEDILSWKKFQTKITELLNEKHNFKTIVLDTYPQSYELCQQHVCEQNDWTHPQDGPYGKGWDEVYRELSVQMNKLITNFGVVLVAHATEKDIEQLDGTVKTQIAPDMKGQAMKFISRSVDIIAYYYYAENGSRYIRVEDNGEIMAKNRVDNHFTGIKKFNAGKTPQEAYENFVSAFNNKLKENENNGKIRTSGNSEKPKRLFRVG